MTTTASALDLPFDEAIDFLKQKVSTPTKSWRDVWDGAHSKAFMVAGANSVAIVDDFKASIQKALETGTTLEEFRKDFDGIVKKHGWSYNGERGWRTRTIFETNLNTAYAAGRYKQQTEPDTLAAFPFWQYHHSGAVHPRLQHKAWDGICLEATDPAWSYMYPPNGFHCGCFTTPVSRPGLRRMGKSIPDRAPDLDQVGTDQKLGIDPSFAYNPGQAWLDHTAPGPQAVTATQANIAAFVTSSLRGKWPDGSWTPVAKANDTMAAALDVPAGSEIRLAAEAIRANAETGPTPATYAVVPRALASTGKIVRRKGKTLLRGKHDGHGYEAELQLVEQGDRTQVHMASLRQIKTRVRK